MKLYYDFHIHSCLSPCGDNDMTPNNLVNMAKLLGLDAIALTDHNTCGNCAATAEVAKKAGLLFLPGMELCTAEEIHVICLFPTVAAAEAFEESLAPFPFVENRPEIFGEQRLCNTKDEIVGCEERLLTVASSMSIDNVAEAVNAFGGVAFPAHIDRPSYSITAALGDIPPLGFTAAELTITADKEQYLKQYPLLQTMTLLTDSDAHYLENMPESTPYIEIAEATPEAVIALLKQRSHIRTR